MRKILRVTLVYNGIYVVTTQKLLRFVMVYKTICLVKYMVLCSRWYDLNFI